MKNQIYTLTCTWAPSYGAVLQAYALAKTVQNLGYDAKVLNYQPRWRNHSVSPFKKALSPLLSLKDSVFSRQYLDFLYKQNIITNKVYQTNDDLNSADLHANAFIVGSDQVWNCTKYYNGKDDAMFLDFAAPNQKRVSYAASLAMPEVPQVQADRYKKMLSKFYAISVREQTGTEALAKIGIENVVTVIDPVYLTDQRDWVELAEKGRKDFTKEKYVLIICLEERDSIYEYARKKADMLGVKLYSFRGGVKIYRKYSNIDKIFWNISVYDYLNIINNAEAVVADSFHAMSFSIIFNRDIDIILRDDKGNSRMLDLLSDLKIAERVTVPDKILTKKIDYIKVKQKIADKVTYATEFLENAIEGGYDE